MQDGAEDDTKNDWAERRTDWAEDRTILANERTFAGWMRTGMASLAIAIGVRVLFDKTSYMLGRAAAMVFVAVALSIFYMAWRKALGTLERLSTHASEPVRTRSMSLIAGGFSLGGIAVGIVLLLM